MREYAVVLLTAALVTFLSTPVVRMVAIRDADGSRVAEVAAGVRELVGAHPAYPEPARAT